MPIFLSFLRPMIQDEVESLPPVNSPSQDSTDHSMTQLNRGFDVAYQDQSIRFPYIHLSCPNQWASSSFEVTVLQRHRFLVLGVVGWIEPAKPLSRPPLNHTQTFVRA